MSHRMPRSNRKTPNKQRDHHIASIAHLFLEDDQTNAADDVSMASNFAVVSASTGAIAAFAAAGLTTSLLEGESVPQTVSLSEPGEINWSAGSYLDKTMFKHCHGATNKSSNADCLPYGFVAENQWNSSRKKEFYANVPARSIQGVNWGILNSANLDGLESCSAQRLAAGVFARSWDVLVWCVLADDLASWQAIYKLGRVAGLLGPGKLEILVFPAHWRHFGTRRWTAEIKTPKAADHLKQTQDLAPWCKHAAEIAKLESYELTWVTQADSTSGNKYHWMSQIAARL